jgi:hypothetical protein
MPQLKPERVGLATYEEPRRRTLTEGGIAKGGIAEGSPLGGIELVGARRRTYVFVLAADGNMYANHWNGSTWQWSNQGRPPAEAFLGEATEGVSAVTYRQGGTQRIHAFVIQKSLYTNFWNGEDWSWADQGLPALKGGLLSGAVDAITYEEGGVQKLYAFTIGSLDWRHFVNHWDGSKWQWTNLGRPSNVKGSLADPHAVTYLDETGKRRIYDFASSGPAALAAGRLYANHWDGATWQWADQGTPGIEPGGQPSVVTYREGATHRIYAFISHGSFKPNLFVNYWNGSQWQWDDLGQPPGLKITSRAEAVTYRAGAVQHIYVFVGCGAHLCICHWNGSKWQWTDQGEAPIGIHYPSLRATAYLEGDTQHIRAFFVGGDRHLWSHYWNGSKWQWRDHGTP